MQFRIGEHPQLMFTWGANVPDKVKVQKVIRLWPLRFKLRFDYDSHAKSSTFGTSCKVCSSLLTFLSYQKTCMTCSCVETCLKL